MPVRPLPAIVFALLLAACTRPAADAAADPAMQAGQARVAELEQQVATLTRSDQISRQANQQLQDTLAQRDEELASLRADLAFYERFLGQSSPARSLTVHAFELSAQDPQVWHFTAALAQTAERDGETRGTLTIAVEGSQDGKLRKLDWGELRQDPKAAPVAWQLRYLQRVEGDLMLPTGFRPVRVLVRLQPARGRVVEQSFPWGEAVRG